MFFIVFFFFFSSRRRHTRWPRDWSSDVCSSDLRLFQERREAAQKLQESLLPPELPQIRGIELHGSYRWGGQGNEVGGDFYDAFDTGDGSWALVIGDVCGKGPDAAVVTGLARHTIRAV